MTENIATNNDIVRVDDIGYDYNGAVDGYGEIVPTLKGVLIA